MFSLRTRDKNAARRSFSLSKCPLLAQSRHGLVHRTCPLSGVKRTWRFVLRMSAYDPKRTLRSRPRSSQLPHIECRKKARGRTWTKLSVSPTEKRVVQYLSDPERNWT